MGGCRHGIAKRMHRKEAPFSLDTVYPCCLFCETLPQDQRAPSEPTDHAVSIMEDLDQSSEQFWHSAMAEVSAQPQPSLAASAVAGVLSQPQPSLAASRQDVPTLNALAFASPSKVKGYTKTPHHAGQLKSATDVIKNVSYQTLLLGCLFRPEFRGFLRIPSYSAHPCWNLCSGSNGMHFRNSARLL